MASHVLATDILDKISRCLSDSPEKLARLLYFLVKEENVERYERVLRSVIDNVVAFKNIVEKLVNDVDHLETDPEYRRLMADIWNNYLKPNEKADIGNGQLLIYNYFLEATKLKPYLLSTLLKHYRDFRRQVRRKSSTE